MLVCKLFKYHANLLYIFDRGRERKPVPLVMCHRPEHDRYYGANNKQAEHCHQCKRTEISLPAYRWIFVFETRPPIEKGEGKKKVYSLLRSERIFKSPIFHTRTHETTRCDTTRCGTARHDTTRTHTQSFPPPPSIRGTLSYLQLQHQLCWYPHLHHCFHFHHYSPQCHC